MRRVMSIWFPQLPLDRWIRRSDPRVHGPFAMTCEIKNALRITHVTQAGLKAGVTVGQNLPDARAICPDLITQISDPERVNLLLCALWRWSDRLSPWAALNAPDGLYLDISGCAHLFGGELEMGVFARTQFTDMNVVSRVGIADTKRAAWALARFSGELISIAKAGQTTAALKELPLAALGIAPQTETDLRRTGLRIIGDLYGRKFSELARRFGLEFTSKLSRALGHAPDPISARAADPVYAARMTVPDPIGLLDDLNLVLSRLANSVCGRLEAAQLGARRFDLTVRCVDKGNQVLSIGFARPCFKPGAVLQQFAKPLDDLRLEFGADWFRLVAKNLEPMKPRQRILGGEAQARAEDFDQLISTLGNRLGFDRVRKFTPQDYHLPELAVSSIEAVRDETPDWHGKKIGRPFRLFQRPERLRTLKAGRPPKKFEWRRAAYKTVTATGPERLAPPWWQNKDIRIRDYWVTHTDRGERLWLMTYPGGNPPEWFVAGRFT